MLATCVELNAPSGQILERTMVDLSVVVSTLGRGRELARLLDNLEQQDLRCFEVIIVDQNTDDRATRAISSRAWRFPLLRLSTPNQRGLSRGRNVGWRHASGKHVVFADDDCWYPPTLFARVEALFQHTHVDFISGRAADEFGRSINGRFEAVPQTIHRDNVWTTSIEWMLFFRREVLEDVGGFDETIGVGASTPWQAAEGQDIVLRALAAGFNGFYDSSLYGHHPELDIAKPDDAMLCKARSYARGMGFVLRRHGYGLRSMITWIGRPSLAALLYGFMGNRSRVLYYRELAMGRLEGWRQKA